jgi:hypothetical protein
LTTPKPLRGPATSGTFRDFPARFLVFLAKQIIMVGSYWHYLNYFGDPKGSKFHLGVKKGGRKKAHYFLIAFSKAQILQKCVL